MKKNAWKKKITEATELAGTYQSYFDPIIDTLASILEKRDDAEALYKKTGSELIIEKTIRVAGGGEKNLMKSPIIQLIEELNRDALQYWRDLGLTPRGLSAISSEIRDEVKKKERPKIEDLRSRFKVG